MPSFTFEGFTIGEQVTLSVEQDGRVASGAVANWGQATPSTMTGSLEILKQHAAAVPAPASVWFEAVNIAGFDVNGGPGPGAVYDPSFDRITYIWTVSGGNAITYTAPELPTAWRDGKIAYGKKVALFFPEPDTTYTVTCWAIDQSGNIGQAVTNFTTSNANQDYPTIRTLCLDPSGAFSGAPAGAQNFTTVSAVQSAVNNATAPCRLLIARGQDIDGFRIDGRGGNLRYIGAFGTGDRPILRATHTSGGMFFFTNGQSPYLTITDCDCRGEWNAATETGHPSGNPMAFERSAMLHLSIWNCRFDGFGLTLLTLNDTSAWIAMLGNTEITNWQDYGMFLPSTPQSRIAYVGCDIAQHDEALNDVLGHRLGLMNQQGPVRATGFGTLYIGASSFLSRGGWAGGIDQSAIRLNSEGNSGTEAIVERSVLEGGGNVLSVAGDSSSNPGNYLFDKVLILNGGGKTGTFGTINFGGTTFRNTLFAFLNVPDADDFAIQQCLDLRGQNATAASLAAEFKLYNCTSLNLRNAANDGGDNPRLYGTVNFTELTDEGNVVHGPDLDTPVTANSVSLTATLPGFTPRYRGIRQNFPFETGTLSANIGSGAHFTLPYPSGTNQAYWQGLPAGDNFHAMRMGNTTHYAAFDSGFSVSYEASHVRITNTSGTTWNSGSNWTLRLDRKSQLPGVDANFGNPSTEIPAPLPVLGSDLFANGDLGMIAYDDFLTEVRPGPGGADHRGQTRPGSGNAQGAFSKAQI